MIEQASLVIGEGNWAVKSDSLLGYKINGGKYYPREMSVVRATTGTRINEDGLVELVPYNLFTYSEQFDNAAWVKERITITANITTAPNGSLTADKIVEDNTTNSHRARQNAISEQGVQYTLSFYLKASERTKARITAGGLNAFANFDLSNGTIIGSPTLCTASIISADNGWYRCSITYTQTSATSSAQLHLAATLNAAGDFSYLGDGVSGIFVWGAQLVEGSTALDYLPTTDRLDVARIDYSSGSGALLVEPQRTNLILQSSSFDNAYWPKSNLTVTANTTTAPDGTTTAETLTEDTANIRHAMNNSVGISSLSGIHTASIYFKNNTRNFAWIQIATDGAAKRYTVVCDLVNGTITSTTTVGSPTSISNSITNVGNGWYRVSISSQHNSGTVFLVCGLSNSATPTYDANGYPTYLGNGTSSIYAWGAQVEVGSYPTSYIPTQAATVTRNADVISKTGISSLFGTNQGTFFIDLVYNNSISPDYLFDVTDSSNTQRFLMFAANNTGLFLIYDSVSGGFSSYQFTKGQRYKIAVKYNSTATYWFINGSLVATGIYGFGYQMSQIYLAQRYSLGEQSQVNINSSAIWPTALTDAQCQTLTTI
jgi:hypothetical protein